ncbi:MAG: hypothetical protein JNK05_32740 [Myxococcales bacterium]|nr:hypothetical protein [Myxococcales bacterium]
MNARGRALEFVRTLALGSLASAAGCERSTTDAPNTFSSGASQPATRDATVADVSAVRVVEDASATAEPTGPVAERRLLHGAACSPVGTRDSEMTAAGRVSCECKAHEGRVQWICDVRVIAIDIIGPLAPPECPLA